jgi:LacI family transcriptional regulator
MNLGLPTSQESTAKGRTQITLQTIADQCGLSVTTVSRVLSGQARQYRISGQAEIQVRRLAKEVGYVPNQLARGLRLRKTSTIGLVIPDISNPFFAGIARQVALGTRRHGYSIILCDSQENLDLEVQSIRLLRSRHVEGMILCPEGQSADHLVEFRQDGLPMVLVDRFFPDLALPYVTSDNRAGAREATEYLIANGHRRIACVQGLLGSSPNELRLSGYREALGQHGIPVDEGLIVGDSFGEQNGYVETKLLLKAQKGVTAILAFSNLIGLGAIRALAEERLGIPEDMSLIHFDDQPYSAHLATPMTTVAQPCAEMGDVAVKLLFDQIQSPLRETSGGIILPTTLVVRRSVKKLMQPN